MLDPAELSPEVLGSIAKNLSDKPMNDDILLAQISELSVHEAFDRYLTWHGIIGYTDMIITALDDLRRAKAIAKTHYKDKPL
jgi:hypothetical protein